MEETGVTGRTHRELCLALIDNYRPDRLEQLLDLLDPDVEWTTTENWIERETWHGREGVRAGLGRFFAEWTDFSHEIEEFRLEDDRFAVVTRMRGIHRHTGIQSEMRTAGVIDVRDGRLIRIVGYSDPEAAMRAVGAER